VVGPFTWNVAGDTVTLEGDGGGRQFRVGEGRLLLLDRDGGVPSWSAPHRVLTRQPAADAGTGAPTSPQGASLGQALQYHRWTLQTATDADGKPLDALLVPGHPFVLHLAGERVGVQGGCNQLSGSWRLDPGNQLKVGPLASTMKACETPLMAADKAMSALLAQPLLFLSDAEADFVLDGQPAAGRTIAELEAALRAEIKRIQDEGVSAEELARVKTQSIAAQIYKRDSLMAQAMEIGGAEAAGVSWRDIDTLLEKLKSVTAAEVQAVAKKYFKDDTLSIAVLDPHTGSVDVASAGHNPPYRFAAGSRRVEPVALSVSLAFLVDFAPERLANEAQPVIGGGRLFLGSKSGPTQAEVLSRTVEEGALGAGVQAREN
jgi:heat shock protein HslJ